MVELTRSNDTVFLSWLMHALSEAGIEAAVLDMHTSVLEGSISAIPRRVVVDDGQLPKARMILAEGEALGSGPVVSGRL